MKMKMTADGRNGVLLEIVPFLEEFVREHVIESVIHPKNLKGVCHVLGRLQRQKPVRKTIAPVGNLGII